MKRAIILMLGLSLSAGIYSEVGVMQVANVSDVFFKKAAEQESKNASRKIVRKAEAMYKKAVENYKNGNKGKAAEYYSDALKILSMVSPEVALNDHSTQEYNVIFSQMNEILDDQSNVVVPQQGAENEDYMQEAGKYTISMDENNELVKKYINLYSQPGNRERIVRALERSGKYREMILKVLRDYDLPEELVYLPIVESLYNNNDLSWAGALGIWQLMPQRARALGLKVNYWIDERKDPEKATRAAAQYLKDLYLMFDDWHLALSAYNRGEFGLGRDLMYSKSTNIEQMSERKAVPKETELFVPQFIATTLIADNLKDYNIDSLKYDDSVKYEEVIINDVIDLKIVAKCCETTVEKIKELNPALRAWCTPCNYPGFVLKLPVGSRDKFVSNIAKVKDLNPSGEFVRYRVQKGDCLDKIAKKFHTSVTALKRDNNLLKSSLLRINQCLVVRPNKKGSSDN